MQVLIQEPKYYKENTVSGQMKMVLILIEIEIMNDNKPNAVKKEVNAGQDLFLFQKNKHNNYEIECLNTSLPFLLQFIVVQWIWECLMLMTHRLLKEMQNQCYKFLKN